MRAFRTVGALVRDSKGGTAIEYGLIVALIVIAIMAALFGLAGATTDMWNGVRDNVIEASKG